MSVNDKHSSLSQSSQIKRFQKHVQIVYSKNLIFHNFFRNINFFEICHLQNILKKNYLDHFIGKSKKKFSQISYLNYFKNFLKNTIQEIFFEYTPRAQYYKPFILRNLRMFVLECLFLATFSRLV